ncbi:hypothetical protein BTVI_04187 [Pitangus sulphuratus]|nr:hypothetical protein BTVI_04187 [Pitangus sulphuratus]
MLCLMHPRTQLALLAARALLTHIQLAIDQIPFHRAAYQHLIPQSVYTSSVAPFQSCIQVINEDVEEHKAQDGALWNATSDRSSVYDPLCFTHEPIAHLLINKIL